VHKRAITHKIAKAKTLTDFMLVDWLDRDARFLDFQCVYANGSCLLGESMAKCDEGYLCQVCGKDVNGLANSDLYLRFVIGMIDPETLHSTAERHIRCNPPLAQFIVDEDFEPIEVEGDFDKRRLDAAFVAARETLVTRGYRRLMEIRNLGLPITEYPLEEVRRKWAGAK
jgi:hypothetical protein